MNAASRVCAGDIMMAAAGPQSGQVLEHDVGLQGRIRRFVVPVDPDGPDAEFVAVF